MSIKGHKSVTNLRKMTGNNPNIDPVNINAYTKFSQHLPIFLKILSRNEILTKIKSHNSVPNKFKMTGINPSLDLVNINA